MTEWWVFIRLGTICVAGVFELELLRGFNVDNDNDGFLIADDNEKLNIDFDVSVEGDTLFAFDKISTFSSLLKCQLSLLSVALLSSKS